MEISKFSSSLIFFIALALIHPSNAQNKPQDYLDAHNAARAELGLEKMTWNKTLKAYAQNYANKRINDCKFEHSDGPYGENFAKGSSDTFSGKEAVNMWVAEKAYYDYESNTCAPGQLCGHYTQVVWNNSVRVGCARVKCTNNGWWFVSCNYDPPGNYIGDRPY